MKRTLAFLLAVSALILLSVSAAASGPALIIRADGCGLYAADGSVFFAPFQAVITESGAGSIVNLTCKGQQPAEVPTPDRAVRFDYKSTGGLCHTPFGYTRNWSVVVTPSGEATMRCQVNPSGW